MAHQNTIKYYNYKKLTNRFNLFPQGAVASDLLFEILKILFSEREAGLVSLLPIKPFNAKKAAGIWKINDSDAQYILNDLADRGILLDVCENVQESVNFICNCCGCCCEALIAARKFGFLNPVHTTNFIPFIVEENCNGCGKCVALCPVEAMTLVSSNDPNKLNRKKVKLNQEICLGCGLCLNGCNKKAIELRSRKERVITPVNSVHRVVTMAIERGKLQNLIFDKQVMFSHRAMAAVLGVILKLPPLKQVLASQQFKSRYLASLIRRQKKSSRTISEIPSTETAKII